MHLTWPAKSNPTGLLILEEGALAGERLRFRPRVCANPVCKCKIITLVCETEQTDSAKLASRIELDFKLVEHQVVCGNESAAPIAGKALASAVAGEIDLSTWNELHRHYLGLKCYYTETADLDEVEAEFPPEAETGTLVGYYEILPYAPPVELTRDNRVWLLDDQYCVRPHCSCQSAAIGFVELHSLSEVEAEVIDAESTVIRFDYRTGGSKVIQEPTEPVLGPEDFLVLLKEAQPDLKSFLARRHAALRQLFQRYQVRRQGQRSSTSFGRNAPCPCGSGKKFKHCCGATGRVRGGPRVG